jgi:hypothetical protein
MLRTVFLVLGVAPPPLLQTTTIAVHTSRTSVAGNNAFQDSARI